MMRCHPKPAARWAAICAALALLSGAQGCQPADGDHRGGGYGDAKVALYANSSLEDDDLHGHLILVDSSGGLTAMSTEGLYGGEPSFRDGRLFISDATSEILLTRDATEERKRSDDNLLLESNGHIADSHVTIFNSGTRDSSEYFSDLVAWLPNGLARGAVEGELFTTFSCSGTQYAIAGSWQDPFGKHKPHLIRMDLKGNSVIPTDVGEIKSPGKNREIQAASCSGNVANILRDHGRGRVQIGEVRLNDARSVWQKSMVLPKTLQDSTFSWVPWRGDFLALDIGTAQVLRVDARHSVIRQLFSVDPLDFASYSVDGDLLVTLEWRTGEDPTVNLYDLRNDHEMRRLALPGLKDFLAREREVLGTSPILLDDAVGQTSEP